MRHRHAVTVLFLDDKPKLKETKLEFYGDVLQPFVRAQPVKASVPQLTASHVC